MNVLVVSPFFPWPLITGANLRIYNMVRELSTRHSVTLVCPVLSSTQDLSGARAALGPLCSSLRLVEQPNDGLFARAALKAIFWFLHFIQGISKEEYYTNLWPLVRAVSRLLDENQYDVLLTNYWYTARKPIQQATIPTVCDTHDVVTEQLERHLAFGDHLPWGRWAAARTLNRVRVREAETLNSHDLLICVTNRDIATIRETLSVGVPSVAIATIRDRTRLPYKIQTSTEEIVLFFGALQSDMNKDAARYLATELFPRIRMARPLSRLIIAGSNANSKIQELGKIEGVSLALHLPFANLLSLIHRSRVALLPLRVGSGIKGRVIEAMEAGIPVVGTSITAEGIPVTHGETMIVSDDPAELVNWTVRLLSDEQLRLRLSQNARQFVEMNYSWATTYGKIHQCLDMACANHGKAHMNEKASRS